MSCFCIELVEPNSLLTLQVLMTLETYYMVIYSAYLILMQFFKGYSTLRYPPSIWLMELFAIIIFTLMQAQRIDLGCRANRNEHPKATLIFTIFTLLCALFYAYFALYTTYVLVFDIVTGVIGIFITTIQFVQGIYAYAVFRSQAKL